MENIRWKGKIVSEKVFYQRKTQASNCNRPKKSHCQSKTIEVNDEAQCENLVTGRRIINISTLAKGLWCCSCKECLSLDLIEKEIREGFGSKLTVRCHKCLLLNIVYTDKQYNTKDERRARFNVNSKMALGKCFNLF